MFKTAAAKIAHNSTIPSLGGNRDLRPLQNLILAEKQVLISLQKFSEDFLKAAEALRIWGSGEGEDLDDILGASTALLSLWAGALSNYATHGHSMRDYLKSIRTREETLDELKKRRRAVSAKADAAEKKLSRMGSEHKNLTVQTDSLNALRVEIRGLDSDIMTQEADIGDYKRTATRAWMGLKFGGLLECAEKGTIAGEFGKLIISEISEEHTQPGMARSLYYGRTKTEQLLSEAHRCIHDVVMSTVSSGNPSGQPAPFQQAQQIYPHHTPQPSLQGTPQNPFGTPQPAFQTTGAQGTDIHSLQQNSNNMALGGPQLGFSPAPQLYLNQPGSPAYEHYSPQPSYIGSQGQPDPSESLPRQSVDDFGVNTRTSGLIDQPENGSGGRFATFPVKNRPSGLSGYTLSDPPRQDSDSFSSSVAQALSSSQSPPVTTTQSDFTNSNQHQQPVSTSPPHFLPPGAAPPESWHADPQREIADDDGGLAYMDGSRESRHVRFGEVNDVDDELERRGRLSNDNDHHYQEPWAQQKVQEKQQPRDDGLPQYHELPPATELAEQKPNAPYHNDHASGELSNTSLISDNPQKQRRIPPPMMSLEDERALNAAAAREVRQELNALHLESPKRDSQTNRETAEWNRVDAHPPPPGLGHNPSSSVSDGSAPLAPPAPLFSARLPSPHPDVDSPTLPYTPPTTAAQPNPQTSYQNPAEYQQRPPSPPYETSGGPTNSGAPRLGASLSAARNESPRLPPLATQTPSSTYGTPYQTPPEYPRSLGMSSTPTNRSSPSLPTQPPPGARTISAAAFKRPQRVATGDVNPSPFPDGQNTSPLSIKKRLPSSPHPQRDGSPQRRGRSGSPAQPPAPAPAQALPPIPTGEDDEDYDYLSAYVETGVPVGAGARESQKATNESQFGARQPGGYGEGRFATDLEGGLR